MTTLGAALLRAVSAHPGLTFADLLDAVRAAGLDVGATEIDAAARALGLEHGEPGAYRYWLPGSVVGDGEIAPERGEDSLGAPVVVRLARERVEASMLGTDRGEPSAVEVGPETRGRPREPSGDKRSYLLGKRGRGGEDNGRRIDGSRPVGVNERSRHPDTIASSPAQSTLPGLWQ